MNTLHDARPESTGTMTVAQIAAMWQNDARVLRARAGLSPEPEDVARRCKANQLEQCAVELLLHLRTEVPA